MIARRAAWVGAIVTVAAAVLVTALDKPVAAVVLTVTAALAMINALWLEDALATILQPGKARFSKGAALLLLARLGVWGALLAAAYVLRRSIELWAVAVGIACALAGLAVAGLGQAGGGEERG